MTDHPGTRGPDLWAVVAPLCGALSLGVLAAALASVRHINPELVMRWDVFSILVGLAAAATGWWLGRGFWRLERGIADDSHRLRRRVLGGVAALGFFILLAFALSITTIPESRRGDMIWGGLFAVVVLSAIGGILLLLARLFGSGTPDGE